MARSLSAGELWTFALLTFALLALWIPEPGGRFTRFVPLWTIPFTAAVSTGWFCGSVGWSGLLWIAALGFASYAYHRIAAGALARFASGAVVLALAAGLLMHALAGFSNPKVISGAVLKPDAVSYTKYLNFDKATVGLLLLAFGIRRITSWRVWRRTLAEAVPVIVLTTSGVLMLAIMLGYVRYEPVKLEPGLLLFWAWSNLFFTCVAEEAAFRGLLQRGFEGALEGKRFAAATSLLIASAIFGLSHFAGGWPYVALSSVAGLGYGYAMQKTGRLEAAIFAHFVLNAIHILLFTYPALSRSVG